MSTTTAETTAGVRRTTGAEAGRVFRRPRAWSFRAVAGGLIVWWLLVPGGLVSAAALLVDTSDVSRPVWIDGEYVGLAPVRVDSLAGGRHRIELGARPGSDEWVSPWATEIELDPDAERRVTAPPLQRLRIVASGRPAPVAIRGQRIGWTPLHLLAPRGEQLEVAVGSELPILYVGTTPESTLVLPTSLPARRAPSLSGNGSRRGLLLPLGAVAFGVLGVWAQQNADSAYDDYLSSLDRSRIRDHYDRAARYDDLAAGFWVAAEILLVASVWSWLRGSSDPGLELEADPAESEVRVGWTWGGDAP